MATKDAEETAFRTPIGNFYYTVTLFGLKNAEVIYQRTITAIFHDMMHKEMEDYLDDILVKSKTRIGHLQVLKQVFKRCREQTTHEPHEMCLRGVCWKVPLVLGTS